MTTYLLPCTCSAMIEVGPGQAGDTVVCRQCAATVAVPKLRDFRHLDPVPAHRPPADRRWGWRQASVLAGAAVALLGGLAAMVVGVKPQSAIDARAIRAAVAAADDRSIIEAWKSLARSGVDRPATPDEQSLRRIVRFRRGAALGLNAVAVAGALAAIAGGIALAATRKESV